MAAFEEALGHPVLWVRFRIFPAIKGQGQFVTERSALRKQIGQAWWRNPGGWRKIISLRGACYGMFHAARNQSAARAGERATAR